jgi:signal transduction histidine kinase
MRRKKLLYLFLIICCPTIIKAKEKTDNKTLYSLLTVLPSIEADKERVNTLNRKAEKFLDINPNQAIIYSNKALLLSKKIKWDDGIASSLISIGKGYNILGNTKKSNLLYEKAFIFARSKLNFSKFYRAKGALERRKSNYPKALDYFFKSLKIGEEIKDKHEIALSYYEIGATYYELRDYKKALLYNKKSLLLNVKLKLKKAMCDNLIIMGEIYRDDNKQYPTALDFFFKALRLGTEIDNKYIITHVYSTIAQIYQLQDKYEEALKHIIIGKKIAEEINDYRLISTYKIDESLIYLLQFEQDSLNPKKHSLLTKAESLLLDGLKDFRKSNDNFNVSVCYDTLTYLYQLQKKFKEATLMAIKYAAIKDSIFSEQSKITVKNLEDQRTIALKEKEIQINKITLETKEKQKWFYILGLGFLSTIGGLLFYQSRKRKKTNEKLEFLNRELDQANKAKVKFLSILNHDLRSPVYNFIHFMQLQKESPELLDSETKKAIETKTISSAENLLGSMEDLLLWSKGQMDNFKPEPKIISINTLFDDTKKHFESEEKVKLTFENPDDIQIYTDENFLKTIIRNLTGNAIKASKEKDNAKITWKAWQAENKTYCSITDHGIGASQEKFKALYDENEVVGIATGLGLHLIRDLAKAINCEILVENNNEKGTIFTLQIS